MFGYNTMTQQITPIEANLETTEAVYNILFGSQDLEALDEYLAEDVVQNVSHDPVLQGIDQVREYFESMYAVMPDISYELLESVADDERVVYHVELSGTMEGDLPLGDEIIEGTGNLVTWEAFSSFRFEDGLVAETNVVVDELSFLQEIGAIPEMSHTAA